MKTIENSTFLNQNPTWIDKFSDIIKELNEEKKAKKELPSSIPNEERRDTS